MSSTIENQRYSTEDKFVDTELGNPNKLGISNKSLAIGFVIVLILLIVIIFVVGYLKGWWLKSKETKPSN